MKKIAIALLAMTAFASNAAVNLMPNTFCFTNGVRATVSTLAGPVSSPTGSVYIVSSVGTTNTFSALPPTGYALDDWYFTDASGVTSSAFLTTNTAASVEATNSIVVKTVSDDSVMLVWRSVSNGGGYYLCPAFSWLKWSLAYNENYTLTSDRGTTEYIYTNAVEIADPSVLFSDRTRAGWEISGWSTTTNGAVEYAIGETVEGLAAKLGVVSNTTVRLYGVWEKTPITITLDAQGGSVASNSVTAYIGETYSLPTPTYEGFSFINWYTKPTGGTSIVSGTTKMTESTVTNTTLYAHWDLLTYSLAYDWNNDAAGSNPTKQSGLGYTNTVTLAEETEIAGWDFLGWAFDSDATNANFSASETLENSGSYLGVTNDNAAITLYGVWEKTPVTVTLDAQGGSVASNSVTMYVGDTYSLPTPEYEGFTFVNWYTQASGGTAIVSGTTTMTESTATNTTLYAHWNLITYSLAYDWNYDGAGTNPTTQSDLGYTNTVTLAEETERTGWMFLGWAFDSDATEADFTAGQTLANSGSYLGVTSDTGDITLYGVWEKTPIVVTLDTQCDDIADDSITVYIDEEYSLSELERAGYYFLGWFTAAEDGDEISDGDTVTDVTITTLYAHWKAKAKYTYQFVYRNSSGEEVATELDEDTTWVYEDEYATEPDDYDEWVGHAFSGWSPESLMPVSNTVYTAAYTTNEYTVAFHANGAQGKMDSQEFVYDVEQALTANTFTYGKTGAWAFGGWATNSTAEVAQFADAEVVSNLTAVADGTVDLYALWQSSLTEWSEALGTDVVIDLQNENDGERDAMWSIVEDDEDADGEDTVHVDATSRTYIGGSVYGNGVLTFVWKVTALGDTGTRFLFNYTGADTVNLYYQSTTVTLDEWQTNTVTLAGLTSTAETELKWTAQGISAVLASVEWVPEGQFEVAFEANGGDGEMDSVLFYEGEYGTLPKCTFTREGWSFAEWNDSSDGEGQSFADEECTDVLTNTVDGVVLYAQWSPIGYAITFDPGEGEGEMDDLTCSYGEEYILPTNTFTLTGYAFTNWVCGDATYSDGETISNLTNEDGVVLTFTAQWEANEYSITFDANGGTGTMADMSMSYDVAANLTANAFTMTGYTFAGWATAADADAAEYEDGEEVVNLATEDGAVVTLYAVWQPIGYTVSFDANGGSGTMDDIAMTYDVAANLTANAFALTGYAFSGWATSADAVVAEYEDGEEVENLATEDGAVVTLYAVWQPIGYTVSFDANGGSGTMDDISMTYDVAANLTTNVFALTGYTFVGWATSADAVVAEYEDGAEVVSLAAENGAAVTLYAVWQPIGYTITFDANGGSGTMDDVAMTYDVAANLPACSFTNDGYAFSGWTFNGSTYAAGASVKNLTDEDGALVVFSASWEKNSSDDDDDDDDDDDSHKVHIFSDGEDAIGEFTASTACVYNGWLRDADTKAIYALLAVKTTIVRKAGAVSKVKIVVTPLSGKKTSYKTTVVPGGNPVDEYGIVYGNLGLTGTFNGYVVEAARDFAKAKAGTAERALAAYMPTGVWTLAFDDGDGWATFSITVKAKGKAAVKGTLSDGTKISITAQGILGTDYVFAVPALKPNKGVGFVFWIPQSGDPYVSDLADTGWSLSDCATLQNLADGAHSPEYTMPTWRDYMTQTDIDAVNVTALGEDSLVVSGGKWKAVKTVGKIVYDKSAQATYVKLSKGKTAANLATLKFTYTVKTGVARGSLKLWYLYGTKVKSDTAKIAGIVVDGVFYGTATVKKLGTFKITMQ